MGDEARALGQVDLEAALEQSAALTKGIFAAVPAGLVHVSSEGSILTANAEALRLLGLSYDELTKRYTQDWEPETVYEDGTPCKAEDYPVSRALMTGEPQPAVTIGVRRPDGSVSWCVFRAVPVKDAGGKTTGAVVTFHDISERIRIAETLRRSEAALKAIVNSAPDIIFTTDREGRFTFTNRVPQNLEQYASTSSILGHSMLAWGRPEDRPMMAELMRRVLEHGETVQYEGKGLEGVDGNIYWNSMGPIIDGDGAVCGIAGVVSIINDRKRQEEERVRLLAQLHEAQRLEALGRLSGGVAHDFNNLLTVIQGSLDLLVLQTDKGALPRGAADRIAEISEAAARASELTQQLLAFGRQQPLKPCTLDVRAVIDGVVPMLRRLVATHVELVVQHDTVGSVRADRLELERVLVNLVTNANDALPRGGTCTIATRRAFLEEGEVEGAAAGRYVALEVHDDGSGMDDDTMKRAFEPFFTTKELGQGTGLGLATVHGIVKQSGGAVSLVAKPGGGTTVRVLLPELDQAPDAALEDAPVSAPKGVETILLIEDEPRVRKVAKLVLETEGYEVIDVPGPEEALALPPDVVASVSLLLSDIVMPKMSGSVVARHLRERAPNMRVLLMSGHVRESLGALPKGFEFISKPFDRATLCAKIRAMLDEPV